MEFLGASGKVIERRPTVDQAPKKLRVVGSTTVGYLSTVINAGHSAPAYTKAIHPTEPAKPHDISLQ